MSSIGQATLEFDRPTAVRVAELLEHDGRPAAAANVWWQLCAIDPYDRHAREKVADLAYQVHAPTMPPPGVERARMILRLIGVSFPTPTLTQAYLESLHATLAGRTRRAEPGRLVIGLGSGRCGTTTLAAMLAAAPDVVATHENPPLVYCEPLVEQLDFHRQRFRLLRERCAVVCDVSYWWMNARDWLRAEFPQTRFVGLIRETRACVESFMQQGGMGRSATNSVAARANGIWRSTPADPTRPDYPTPPGAAGDPDGARRAMLARYVDAYNQALAQMAAAEPDCVLILRTEELNDPRACARLSDFLGMAVQVLPTPLNVGTRDDGSSLAWYF